MKFASPEEELVAAFVRGVFAGNDVGAHTFEHTIRVYKIAREIAAGINADLRIIGAAALLHDIGRVKEKETGVSHAILSGQMGKEALRRAGYSEVEVQQIIEAIRTHRFSENLTPTSLEGKILSDADKIDAMGAIGVFRAIAQAANTGKGIMRFVEHANAKLLKLRELLFTEKAKELAEPRYQILKMFVEQLKKELNY